MHYKTGTRKPDRTSADPIRPSGYVLDDRLNGVPHSTLDLANYLIRTICVCLNNKANNALPRIIPHAERTAPPVLLFVT